MWDRLLSSDEMVHHLVANDVKTYNTEVILSRCVGDRKLYTENYSVYTRKSRAVLLPSLVKRKWVIPFVRVES